MRKGRKGEAREEGEDGSFRGEGVRRGRVVRRERGGEVRLGVEGRAQLCESLQSSRVATLDRKISTPN